MRVIKMITNRAWTATASRSQEDCCIPWKVQKRPRYKCYDNFLCVKNFQLNKKVKQKVKYYKYLFVRGNTKEDDGIGSGTCDPVTKIYCLIRRITYAWLLFLYAYINIGGFECLHCDYDLTASSRTKRILCKKEAITRAYEYSSFSK